MASPLMIRSVSDAQYDYGLSVQYRGQWVYDQDLPLSREPDVWEIVRRDPVILSAMDRRSRNIVRPWRVEAGKNSRNKLDREYASVVEDGISNIQRFNAARRRLVEAAFLGRTYAFIEWERRLVSLADTPPQEWLIPVRLRDIDRRRIRLVVDWTQDKRTKTGVHPEMYDTDQNRWFPLSRQFSENLISYTYYDTEDRLGYGRGLMEATYFYHFMKTTGIEKIQQGIDRWANGIIIGELDPDRNASVGKTNEVLRLGMKTLLQQMRSEHIAVFQKGDKVEVVETSGAGHEITMNWVRYLDEGIERLYNGSVLPSGHAQEAGSKARSETESDTSEAFYQSDREDADAVLDRDLVGAFIRNNRLSLEALGYIDAKRPHFTSEQSKREDPAIAVTVMNAALDKGVPLVRDEYYSKINMSVPGEDDDVIEGVNISMAGMGVDDDGFPAPKPPPVDPNKTKPKGDA